MADVPATPRPGTPRWVKVFGIVALVAVIVVVVLLLVGGEEHGPGRHLDGDEPPSGPQQRHVPPPGGH